MDVISISEGSISAKIVSVGACLFDLRLEGHEKSLVLAHEDLESYRVNAPYLGAIVGRIANRIGDAKFETSDKIYQLDKNWLGKHCLHSGTFGTAFQNWETVHKSKNSVTLAMIDRGAETGFPGDCRINVTYSCLEANRLEIAIEAVCDKATPISITAHPYFNLGNETSIANHRLELNAQHYLELDKALLPTGKLIDVANTDFDFSNYREMLHNGVGYDHNFCIANTRSEIREMARVFAPDTNIEMLVSSNETGLQFYTGGGLDDPFAPHQGFCLEPQAWPDAPNQPGFPNCWIDPQERYQHKIQYAFSQV